ncbi:GNAT family N-acetyltransferase [Pontixanthobacter sp. CEM42]|uniref:GNAT family N-acetyltransferase n=1 Tax=Pontixanthobacter sp. CEM42 TaxID=2792077 RepID=UPI0032AFE859
MMARRSSQKFGYEIRKLERHDHLIWLRLWSAYLRFYDETLPDATSQRTWERLVDEMRPGITGLVAEQADGCIVGFTHFLAQRHTWHVKKVVYLQDLYVERSSRGRGVGGALINAVFREAADIGAPHVYWLTKSDNHSARKLYDRMGEITDFVRYQTVQG